MHFHEVKARTHWARPQHNGAYFTNIILFTTGLHLTGWPGGKKKRPRRGRFPAIELSLLGAAGHFRYPLRARFDFAGSYEITGSAGCPLLAGQ